MPGPPKKPTALKILQGNPGRRPLPANEPQLPVSAPDPPAHLSQNAREHWVRIVTQLAAAGIMTSLDSDALAAYCEAYQRWLDANQNLVQYGSVLSEDGIPKPSPYLRVASDAFQQMRYLLAEFGLSPASRARIQAAPPAKDENPFASVRRKK